MTSSKHKVRTLSAGRPRTIKKSKAALSASATRTLIRSHHQLHKLLHKAKETNDERQVQALQEQIESLGGLDSYQQASILGQAKERGGDSSTVLMQWLQPVQGLLKSVKPRLLEIGALSTKNACTRSGIFDTVHIDLNSQEEGILSQDFMDRPLPIDNTQRFDIISLSLVLNYVPDAAQRGEMLKRTLLFLRKRTDLSEEVDRILPALFVVLPAPCVSNSRYLNNERFQLIMNSIGYELLHEKKTAKLVYSLWKLAHVTMQRSFLKVEVNPGSKRNNFTIILNPA